MSHYIIVDLEATCEVEQTDQYLSEIIEIGACLATEDGEIVSEFQTFIRPVINPLLSEMCKTLTSISQPDVDSAPPYHEAIAAFDNWVMDSAATFSVTGWCSWGGYDKRQFVRNAALFEAASPHLLTLDYLNLKQVYARVVGRGKKMVGLRKALASERLDFVGIPHRGIDDAKNTARLLPIALGLKSSVWIPGNTN